MADINGTNVASKIVPYTTADEYATHDEQYGVGGYRTVDSVSEMNAIPAARRKEGMLVNVKGDKIYKLNSSNTFVDAGLGGSGGSEVYQVDVSKLDFTQVADGVSASQDQIAEVANCIIYWAQGKPVIYNNPNAILSIGDYVGTLNIGFNPSTMVASFIMPFSQDGGDGAFLYMLDTQAASWTVQKLGADDCFNASNLSQNGYVKFQNGLMLQWGYVGGSATASYRVTMPMSFYNTTYNVFATVNKPSSDNSIYSASPLATSKTVSAFYINRNYASGGSTGLSQESWQWFAVGRWK